MSQPSLTKQDPDAQDGSMFSLLGAALPLILFFVALVFAALAYWINSGNNDIRHQTQLEQEAAQSDLQVINVQVCGITDDHILTSEGVFEADAVKFPVKLWGAYEFAVDGNKLVLHGPANPEHGISRC